MDELEFTYWFPKVFHMFGYKKLHFLTEDNDSLPPTPHKIQKLQNFEKSQKVYGHPSPLKLLGPLNSTFFQIFLFLPLVFLVSALQGFSK